MKYNVWTIIFSALGGAFVCFFALTYWNLFSVIKQTEKADAAQDASITKNENFLRGDSQGAQQ